MRLAPTPAHTPTVPRTSSSPGVGSASPRQATQPLAVREQAAAVFDGVDVAVAKPGAATTAASALRVWRSDYLAPIADEGLRDGLDVLHAFHQDKGFFANRFDGTRAVGGLGEDADLEVMLAPNRKSGMKPSCGCPFCRKSDVDGRGLSWRGWRVVPNAYPYAPAQSQHTVIAYEGHREQTCDAGILADMIAYQSFADDGRGVTLHYNGTAGNSQKHLHWHSSQERLPVEAWLDDGDAHVEDLRTTDAGRVASYAHGAFSGLLVEGKAEFVSRWGARLADKLAADDKTGGRYNMLLLPQKAGRARLVIVPRRAQSDDMPTLGGAWAVVGRDVKYEHEVPADYADTLQQAVHAHTVRADELPWLSDVVARPESGALFLRCGA